MTGNITGETAPLVSVIIPVYEALAYIGDTLDCLLGQTLQSMEILMVDDWGQDGTMDVIRDRAAKDSRIRILRTPVNSGAGTARNIGIEQARGKYIAFFDADDLCDVDFYEKLTRKAEESGCAIVKGSRANLLEDGKIQQRRDNENLQRVLAAGTPLYHAFSWQHQTAIFLRSHVMESGARNGSTRQDEDTTFLVHVCIGMEDKFCCCDDAVYYYRQHGSSLTHMRDASYYLAQVQAKMEKLEILNARVVPDSRYLRFCAHLLDNLMSVLPDAATTESADVVDRYLSNILVFIGKVENNGLIVPYLRNAAARALMFYPKRKREGQSVLQYLLASTLPLVPLQPNEGKNASASPHAPMENRSYYRIFGILVFKTKVAVLREDYYLFGVIRIAKIKKRQTRRTVLLFGFIPVFSTSKKCCPVKGR